MTMLSAEQLRTLPKKELSSLYKKTRNKRDEYLPVVGTFDDEHPLVQTYYDLKEYCSLIMMIRLHPA